MGWGKVNKIWGEGQTKFLRPHKGMFKWAIVMKCHRPSLASVLVGTSGLLYFPAEALSVLCTALFPVPSRGLGSRIC